jgi:hypothetical protein
VWHPCCLASRQRWTARPYVVVAWATHDRLPAKPIWHFGRGGFICPRTAHTKADMSSSMLSAELMSGFSLEQWDQNHAHAEQLPSSQKFPLSTDL